MRWGPEFCDQSVLVPPQTITHDDCHLRYGHLTASRSTQLAAVAASNICSTTANDQVLTCLLFNVANLMLCCGAMPRHTFLRAREVVVDTSAFTMVLATSNTTFENWKGITSDRTSRPALNPIFVLCPAYAAGYDT